MNLWLHKSNKKLNDGNITSKVLRLKLQSSIIRISITRFSTLCNTSFAQIISIWVWCLGIMHYIDKRSANAWTGNIGWYQSRRSRLLVCCISGIHLYTQAICKMAGQTRFDQWQIKVCQELSVPHLATPCLYKSETEPLGNSSEIYNTINKVRWQLFFRAVAYAVKCDEENPEVIRSMMTSFVRNEDSVNLSDIIQNKTPEQYVGKSDM